MINEIGSEFWISKNQTDKGNSLPSWVSKYGNTVLTSSGRGAISLLLSILNPKYRTVLMPSYICESILYPFLLYNYKMIYYDINEDLEPEIEHIENLNEIGVFYHMGYYGFQTNACLSNIIPLFRNKGTIVINDVTHTLLSYFEDIESDFYVGSIRKWMGIPSGGFLATGRSLDHIELPKNEQFAQIRYEALKLKAFYMNQGVMDSSEIKPLFLKLFAQGENILETDFKPYAIDEQSSKIITSCDSDFIVERRRNNYFTLLNGLQEIAHIETIFKLLPNDICPFFYPIYINQFRDVIRRHLIDNRIYCPIHWPLPESIECSKEFKAKKIYSTILSIPCDQRYTETDMNRIVSILAEINISKG